MNRRIHLTPRRFGALGLAALLAGCGAGSAGAFGGDGGEATGIGTTQTTGAGGSGGSATGNGGSAGGAGGGSTTTAAGGAGGSTATSTATGGSGGTGGSATTSTASTSSTSSTAETCAAVSTLAQQIPLDMYIMLDQSGSMDGGKWTSVTAALKTFVQQPDAAGIGVGIQYFGLPPSGSCPATCKTDADCGACGPCVPFFGICSGGLGGDSCNAADYAKAEVEIAPLPGVAQAIIDSMAKHSPSTGTPTHPALEGAITHAKAWASANPTHAVITVLATDGEPSGCNEDMNDIKALAAAGANGTPKILTFVIGVGGSLTALNGIAQSGGTGQAFLVEGQDVDQQFLDAMNAIRGAALGCTYLIPAPKPGEVVDFNKVNVIYTPGDGTPAQTIGKVNGEANCPPNGDGWYYNDEQNPSTILLCASTCTKVAADDKGQVDVAVGCMTQHQ